MSEDGHSLSARVFHTLREEILSGKYQKDEELKEKTIGEELGVSRTPVREALRQLELEGLVTIIPNRGAFVEGISKDDIQDIYEIRSLLEGLCAKKAVTGITEKELEELEENLYLTEFHIQKEHYEQILELDNRFHEILYEASKSKMLKHVLSDFHPIGGRDVLDSEDFLVSSILLPLGSLIYLLFCVTRWGWGFKNYQAEANAGKGMKVAGWMRWLFMIVLPLMILAIFIIGLTG